MIYATIAAVLGCTCFFAWRAVRFIRDGQAEVKAWVDAHSGSNVIGKTPEQIVETFGEPYADGRRARREPAFIMYKDIKYGTGCRIDFEGGKAVRVSFWSQ